MTTTTGSTSVALPTAPPLDHGVEVGAIFVSEWGWEQTNINFYQVTRVTPKMVEVQRLESRVVRQVGWASNEVEPIPQSNYGRPFRRQATDSGYGPYIRINAWKAAGLWNGKPCLATYYA